MYDYKFKVTPADKKQERHSGLLGKYFSIAPPKLIEGIRVEIYHPKKNLKERKKAYEDFKHIIFALKPLFKEIILESNRIFKDEKCKNYFEFAIKRDKIPQKKIDLFFRKADKIIKDINQNLPLPKELPKWYWSKFNIPDALYSFKNRRYLIPDDIYQLVKKTFPKTEIEKIIPRIKIEKIKDFNPAAKFDRETKSIIIETPTRPSIYNALDFVHEFGHALSFAKLAEKEIDYLSKSRYWHEKQAYKFLFQFEKQCLPEKIKNASRQSILGDFLTTFFEYEIYNNPSQDFDQAYAKAINRCYPKANQKQNPFYVLENGLIFRPCSALVNSVVWASLL